MPNYSKGKVYSITSGDNTYIGSTCDTLAKRLSNHVYNYKAWKNGKTYKCSSFQLIELGDYQITLVELCPCSSKDELTARERHWIENTVCVNKQHPGRTRQEYRQDNKDIILEKARAYHDANKDRINEAHRIRRKLKKVPLVF